MIKARGKIAGKETPPVDGQQAAEAARALRAIVADPATAGERTVAHFDLARPRRGVWVEMWSNLPGLMRDCRSGQYTHVLLPGWQYTAYEVRSEMIEDLEHLALTGEQPKTATR